MQTLTKGRLSLDPRPFCPVKKGLGSRLRKAMDMKGSWFTSNKGLIIQATKNIAFYDVALIHWLASNTCMHV